uniref:Rieske (2Fe-2S) iron-sulfur domain protein n=1 Tax=uncultured bacterium UPO45 TaxID=1776970 RepID=A0A126SY28_9BACT|nr:Rieske (2Fe-2S) iron-sulfur domain protein [uncultured bacterium UPO45]
MPERNAGQRSLTSLPSIEFVPVEPNISAEYFEREREKIFKHVWLKIGRVEEIPRPGDYVVKDLAILRTSLLVINGPDGVIRAFHNICRHRGNRLVKTCGGSAQHFFCGFHGWTYDAHGRLTYIPQEEEFGALNKDTYGLLQVPLDLWEGFIFINVDPAPTETLTAYLGEVGALVHGYPFAQMELAGRWTAEIAANWKTFQDAFVEGYHVSAVHRRSIPDYRKNPLIAGSRTLGRHSNLTFYLELQHEPLPAESWAFKAGALAFLQSGAADGAGAKRPAGLNREQKPNWIFDEFLLFPNFHLFLGDGWMLCHDFWPVTVDRTDWMVSYYLAKTDNPAVKIAQEYSKVTMRDTIREDLSTIENTHAAHRSGALSHMVVSSQLEGLITHHHKVVTSYVDGAHGK